MCYFTHPAIIIWHVPVYVIAFAIIWICYVTDPAVIICIFSLYLIAFTIVWMCYFTNPTIIIWHLFTLCTCICSNLNVLFHTPSHHVSTFLCVVASAVIRMCYSQPSLTSPDLKPTMTIEVKYRILRAESIHSYSVHWQLAMRQRCLGRCCGNLLAISVQTSAQHKNTEIT